MRTRLRQLRWHVAQVETPDRQLRPDARAQLSAPNEEPHASDGKYGDAYNDEMDGARRSLQRVPGEIGDQGLA